MSAPAGNINAEKWTLGNVEFLLLEIEDLVDEPTVLFLEEALGMRNAYGKLWWRLKRKFNCNEDITHRMDLIEQKFENKILRGVLQGRYKEKAARMVVERNARHRFPETPEAVYSGVPDEMIEAVEQEVGELSSSMRTEVDQRRVIAQANGKSKAQLIEEGFHFWGSDMYAPGEKGYIDGDGSWSPCKYADYDEWCQMCGDCKEAA